jgi:hypothetical protein
LISPLFSHRRRVRPRLKVQQAQLGHQLGGEPHAARVGRKRERGLAGGGGVAVAEQDDLK